MTRADIFARIDVERLRQARIHTITVADLADNPPACLVILAEEVGEVARAIQDGDTEDLQRELVEVAAVAVAWLEGLR